MQNPQTVLEQERIQLLRKIESLPMFRRGTVSEVYRKCGKPTCHCQGEGERGHGPLYLWTKKVGSKTVAKSLSSVEDRERYREETTHYREFRQLCDRLIEVNEALCEVSSSTRVTENRVEVKKKRPKRARRS